MRKACSMRRASGDKRDDALVLVGSSQRGKSSVVDSVYRDADSFRALDQLAHAPIVARVSDVEVAHALRLRAQSSDDGMESEQMARVGHVKSGEPRARLAPPFCVQRAWRGDPPLGIISSLLQGSARTLADGHSGLL